jgi:peptidyl-tRNA hydrolase
VIVRSDLPRGLQAAQVVHAAGESSPGNLAPGTFAVVLSVANEEELLDVGARLLRERVPFVPIYEPDAPFSGALMAIGLRPARKEVLRRHVSSLKLLR